MSENANLILRESLVTLLAFAELVMLIKKKKQSKRNLFKYKSITSIAFIISGLLLLFGSILFSLVPLTYSHFDLKLFRPSSLAISLLSIYYGFIAPSINDKGIITSLDFLSWEDVSDYSWQGYSFKGILKGSLTSADVDESKKSILVAHKSIEPGLIFKRETFKMRIPKDKKMHVENIFRNHMKNIKSY